MAREPAIRAKKFASHGIYHSSQTPGYSSWVSFFAGERGQWYIGLEEVRKPEEPLPKASRQSWYEVSLPVGYDKSQYLMEAVILESNDGMKTWKEVSRQAYHHQHSVHQFATTRTKDGRFLRFIWACYSLDPSVKPNEIFYVSDDEGKTWQKMPPFHHEQFRSTPHRLRTLRDGTIVLAIPLSPRYGKGTDHPIRATQNLDAVAQSSMCLCFSYDQGYTWSDLLPIYGGQIVSETDFVELPGGDLLCINNSIFANPGRQRIYRSTDPQGRTAWTPGCLERAHGKNGIGEANQVPETVALTEDGILVGCMRAGRYSWSDDLGIMWYGLEGVPDIGREVYQPWIHYLGENRFACAGHFGRDAPISGDDRDDQTINLHLFSIEVLRKTKNTELQVVRDYDEDAGRWRNAYTISLLCEGEPVPDKEIEFWYAERDKPGYDGRGQRRIEERMAAGGKLIRARTDAGGNAHVELSELDDLDYIHRDWPAPRDVHLSYTLVVRFNQDGQYPEYKPAQSSQFGFYAISYQDPPIGGEPVSK